MSATDTSRARKELLESILELARAEQIILIEEKSGEDGSAPVIDRERPILQIIKMVEEHFRDGCTTTTLSAVREVAEMRASGQSWKEVEDATGRDVSDYRKKSRLGEVFKFQEYIARFWMK
jgi:hypothetical protein